MSTKNGKHRQASSESSGNQSDSSSVGRGGRSSSSGSDDSEQLLTEFGKILTKKKEKQLQEAYDSDESDNYD